MKTASVLASLILSLGPIVITMVMGLEAEELIIPLYSGLIIIGVNALIRMVEFWNETTEPELQVRGMQREQRSAVSRFILG